MDASSLDIRLLGSFRLSQGDQPVKGFGQTRLQFLLAYLVLHGGVSLSRQQLAFAFWPDTGDDMARSNLRTLLHRLRAALPDSERFLDMTAHHILWRSNAPFSLDVADFEAALARAQRAARARDGAAERLALEEAVDAYAGDLLPDCFDDWVAPLRERLSQAALRAIERLILLREGAQDYGGALQVGQRLLRLDPLHEAAYRHLMRLHAQSGDRTGVVRVFHTCESVLRHELDVPPAPETVSTYQAALKQAASVSAAARPALPSSQKHNLPPQLTTLVGREREVEQVTGFLAAHRLVTVTGSGGVGKTRLALAVAAELLAAFPDGVCWVDLEPVADEAFVAQTVAEALRLAAAGSGATTQTVAEHLASRRLLLLLDNCEHLSGAVRELVRTLLHAAPNLRILVTSQQALGLRGEIVWRLPSLGVPSSGPAPGLETTDGNLMASLRQSASVQLFVERAQTVLPTFALTAENAGDIAQICRRLDGIPLAVELAASRVRALTPAQIAGRLDDMVGLLARQTPSMVARHRTLQATLDWSYGLLSPRERVLFNRLAVFAGSFTLEAAEAICSDTCLLAPHLLGLLAELEDKSLVETEPIQGRMRFRLHEVLRQYAFARLAEAGERERVQARHLDYYARLVAEMEPKLTGPEQSGWLDRLEAEHDNLRAAMAHSLAPGAVIENGLRIAGGLLRFWSTRGHFAEGWRWAWDLAAAAPAVPPTAARVKALGTAGHLAYLQGDYAAARACGEEALAAARMLGDGRLLAPITRGLGAVAQAQGDDEIARRRFEESLALCRETGDRWGEATALVNLGVTAYRHDDPAAARGFLQAGLDRRRDLGDEVGIAYVLHVLADVAWSEGRQAEATGLNQESLKLRRRLGDKWGIAYSLDSLAVIASAQGDGVRARALFRECLLLFHELGSQRAISATLDHLAGLLAAEASNAQAAQLMAVAAGMREAMHAALPPNGRAAYEQQLAGLRAQLGDEHFYGAWTLGRAMAKEQAVRYALEIALA